MWDSETEEVIESVNPGRAGQTVKINIPFYCENGWIIRKNYTIRELKPDTI